MICYYTNYGLSGLNAGCASVKPPFDAETLLNDHFMNNKYNEGDTVYAKVFPTISLRIRRYVNRIYYCLDPANSRSEEVVYFERELMEKADELPLPVPPLSGR
jgi:hypothetical protein